MISEDHNRWQEERNRRFALSFSKKGSDDACRSPIEQRTLEVIDSIVQNFLVEFAFGANRY